MRRADRPAEPGAGRRAWRRRAGAWLLCGAIEAIAVGGSVVELAAADAGAPPGAPALAEALYATSRSVAASSVEAFDAVSSKLPWTAASIALSSAISM